MKKSSCHIEVIDGGLANTDADATNPFVVQGGKGSSKAVPKWSSNMARGILDVKMRSVDDFIAGG